MYTREVTSTSWKMIQFSSGSWSNSYKEAWSKEKSEKEHHSFGSKRNMFSMKKNILFIKINNTFTDDDGWIWTMDPWPSIVQNTFPTDLRGMDTN